MSTCSPATDIYFSQVREDPLAEFALVDRLARRHPGRPLRVAMVASGGCTALTLLAHPAIARIDAIDLNPAQLHLVALRLAAIDMLDLDDQLALIGEVECLPGDRRCLYDGVRPALPEAARRYWDERPEAIAYGVNRVGRYEQIFRELAAALRARGLEPTDRHAAPWQSPDFAAAFEEAFALPRLLDAFGPEAVSYSVQRTFAAHFAEVFAGAMARFDSADNYFLAQVWNDRYAPGARPAYLSPTFQSAIRSAPSGRLHLHGGAFLTHLADLAQEAPFDLIHTSNITDWMPPAALDAMLSTIRACLAPGGTLVARRLNSDGDLSEAVSRHLSVDQPLSEHLTASDRAFFYRQIVVADHLETVS